MNVARFIGIPYESKGQSFSGCDCYGVCKLICELKDKLKLPSYFYNDAFDIESVEKAMSGRFDWNELDEPVDGCIVVINISGKPIHCGYVLNAESGQMIHSMRGHNSALDNFKRDRWASRIEGFYSYG